MRRSTIFVLSSLLIFALLFVVLTLAVSRQIPSITLIHVVQYGFPFSWFELTSHTVGAADLHYRLMWAGLVYDVLIYAWAAIIASYLITRFYGKSRTS